MLRVIGGKYKHRKLEQPPLDITRSTKDSAKEGLFSSLGLNIIDSSFLDLFAGSGAIGIEAYSRGAKFVYLNDINKIAFKIIKDNVKKFEINDIAITNLDEKECLKLYSTKNIKFDYVFLDPPYKNIVNLDYLLNFSKLDLLNKNFTIIVETDYQLEDQILNYFKIKQLKYGKTLIYILKEKEKWK